MSKNKCVRESESNHVYDTNNHCLSSNISKCPLVFDYNNYQVKVDFNKNRIVLLKNQWIKITSKEHKFMHKKNIYHAHRSQHSVRVFGFRLRVD